MSEARVRIVFFGSPQFAGPTLTRLIGSTHRVAGVVTQPDKPSGRGQRINVGPVKALALAHHVPVLQPERLKSPDFLEAFSSLSPDLGVVAAYGKILPEDVLRVPRLGLINVHASLLPRWRGAAPVERAVMAGDKETGVTIMRVVRALDAGPTFASITRPISDTETAEVVERDLAEMGADLLMKVIDQMAAGRAQETPQDESRATYAPRLTKEEGLIDWNQPARVIHDKVRGLQPWPHAYTYLDGARFILHRSNVAAPVDAPPGAIVQTAGGELLVAAGDGRALRIEEIQAEGRRPMHARQFLAGFRLKPGSRFGGPLPQ